MAQTRKRLSMSEIIERKGLDVATDRVKSKVAAELAKAAECDAQAKEHRANASQFQSDYAQIAKAQLEKLAAATAAPATA